MVVQGVRASVQGAKIREALICVACAGCAGCAGIYIREGGFVF